MRKVNLFIMLAVSVFALSAQAIADVPAITGTVGDGTLLAREWLNDSTPGAGSIDPYARYLTVNDGADAGVLGAFDIDKITLLQQIDPPFDPTAVVPPADNGIYLLVETIATPDLSDPSASFSLEADFDGDGSNDITFVHTQLAGFNKIVWTKLPGTLFNPGAIPLQGTCLDELNAISAGCHVAVGSVLEYFFETRTGGVPHALFPLSFKGVIRSQDNTNAPDDEAFGSFPVIPEPSSMFMFGSAILGLFGAKFRKQ